MTSLEERMIATLKRNEENAKNEEFYLGQNTDHDFSAVLDEFAPDITSGYMFRYADGREERFIFED